MPTPIRALAIPVAPGALTLDALHALTGLALRSGALVSARGTTADAHSFEWLTARPQQEAAPLVASIGDTTWTLGRHDDAAEAWFVASPHATPRVPPDERWWSTLDAFAAAPLSSLPELQEHLAQVFEIPYTWQLKELADAPEAADALAPEDGVIARLVPTASDVMLAVEFSQPPQVVRDALLHLCAHAELGHVRPGDHWGHWDTLSSVSSESPHRQWDRDVVALLDATCPRPKSRKVSSLEECTPVEKAWLVLQGHISNLVGETRTLHPQAGSYQSAAYQRQAAQRIVTQLEEYAGAMLCDGVGLGKTYVATTVIVHYANVWRERLAALDASTTTDPFRITILAPNSGVSTWRREALPPLAAHGVPLGSVRVLSHTKLSRIQANSEILQRSPGSLSDIEHLLLSDLVIVDEARNFRSVAAKRTVVLRDLLRLQPRKDLRRKVLLLTATPVNNSLEDLRQQASLLFSKPPWFNDNATATGYRVRVARNTEERYSITQCLLPTTLRSSAARQNGQAEAGNIHLAASRTPK